MLSKGNSNVNVCINNILSTFKSEVPYSRNKGISHEILDMPAGEAEPELVESGELAIDKYEERVDVDDIKMEIINENGNLKYGIEITQKDT